MEVKFNDQCKEIIRRLELDPAIVVATCNHRTRGLVVRGNPMQMYVTTWHSNNKIIYASGQITRSEKEKGRLHIQEVTLSLALQLRKQLPEGDIGQNMNMEEILKIVTNSFGLMFSVNPDAVPCRLYEGSWHGADFSPRINIVEKIENDFCYVTGVFNNDRTCHHVWVFSYSKYRDWFLRS